jgi:hypothetical protein
MKIQYRFMKIFSVALSPKPGGESRRYLFRQFNRVTPADGLGIRFNHRQDGYSNAAIRAVNLNGDFLPGLVTVPRGNDYSIHWPRFSLRNCDFVRAAKPGRPIMHPTGDVEH